MDGKFARKGIKAWRLKKLKPNPRQKVFRPHTQREIADLAEQLDREGLNCPVEITPDGYIICGHGRVAAARYLGWDTITCWVRHDLATQGEDAVFQRLVEDNLHRRQLSKLGIGRAYLALKEQEYDSWRTKEQEQARGDFRDYLGEILGCDGTTAERWARLAVLPCEYDQLLESNLLSQQQAAKIVKHLPADIQDRLGKTLVGIADSDLDRTAKKSKIRAAVDARLGSKNQVANRSSPARPETWELAVTKVAQILPAPIADFADLVDSSNNIHALLRTLHRKCPQAVSVLCDSELDVSHVDGDQLRRGALALLGLLHIACASQD